MKKAKIIAGLATAAVIALATTKKVRAQSARCPYLEYGDDYGGKCSLGGHQSGYDYNRYCLSVDQWLNCPNYQGRIK